MSTAVCSSSEAADTDTATLWQATAEEAGTTRPLCSRCVAWSWQPMLNPLHASNSLITTQQSSIHFASAAVHADHWLSAFVSMVAGLCAAKAAVQCLTPGFCMSAGLFSPPATLPGPGEAIAFTPHHSSLAGASGMSCPGSAGDDGFVLHMSQTYSRASQPAISPSVAAGLSAPQAEDADAAAEAGVSTTPSQDSRVSSRWWPKQRSRKLPRLQQQLHFC